MPGKPGYASRSIANDDDARDVIEFIRMNYDRAVKRHAAAGRCSEPTRHRDPGSVVERVRRGEHR